MDESELEVPWDKAALRIVGQLERSIVRLDLDSQAEFVSLRNVIEVHLEYGAVDTHVLRHLTDILRFDLRPRSTAKDSSWTRVSTPSCSDSLP